jgi:hypothetical protein
LNESEQPEKSDSQLRRSFPGLVVFLNVIFSERTGRIFWMFDVGAKAILFEQDLLFKILG